MELVLRRPPRCFDCDHAVGPTGQHVTNGRHVWCRSCGGGPHRMSMAMPYQGQWVTKAVAK